MSDGIGPAKGLEGCWETGKGSFGPDLKIDNNLPALYARRFARLHPKHERFFRTREQVSARSPARGDEPLRANL